MKKILALVCALALMLSVACVASAESAKTDLVVLMNEDLITFDPIGTSELTNMTILKLMYLRLYTRDENQQPVQMLCEEYTKPSETEHLFKIYEGVLFEDGTEVTAEDVAYSLTRAANSTGFATFWKNVQSVEAVDTYTVKITTEGAAPEILTALSHACSCILPKAYIEEAEATGDWSSPVCSAQYKLGERDVDITKIVKNENYFDEATAAKNTSLTFRNVPETSSRTIMVQSGDADVNYSFSTAEYALVVDDPSVELFSTPGTSVQYFGMVCDVAPFDNVLVRQACEYAIDRESALILAAEELGVVDYSVVPPNSLGYVENPGNYEYNPEKAKELLAEAGYPDGFDCEIAVFNDKGQALAECVQYDLKQVGINATIGRYETSVRQSMFDSNQICCFCMSWGAEPDPELVYPRLFTKAAIGGYNYAHYSSDTVEELLQAARSTSVTEERAELYAQVQEQILADAAWAPCFVGNTYVLAHAGLQGVQLDGEGMINLQDLTY